MTNDEQIFERVELEMKKHRPKPTCTDYIDNHDKVWTREKRNEWNERSKNTIKKIINKYNNEKETINLFK